MKPQFNSQFTIDGFIDLKDVYIQDNDKDRVWVRFQLSGYGDLNLSLTISEAQKLKDWIGSTLQDVDIKKRKII